MIRRAVFLLLAAGIAFGAGSAPTLKQLKKSWKKLDRDAKLEGLRKLHADPSSAVVSQCGPWLKDKDPVVRGNVVRLLGACSMDPKLHARATQAVLDYVKAHLAWRTRQEDREFARVCRKHGTKLPEGPAIGEGSNYQDPYDEQRRPLPKEIKEERVHTLEVVAALEQMVGAETLRALLRIFREHHDPEVLARVTVAFKKRKDWRVLPAMADLVRIQEQGRAMGGGVVIGQEKFRELRLKWDLHKDRLWWSRPEYVTRVGPPIREVAGAITGVKFATAAELDKWLLDHPALLKEHGVKLTAAFRARAAESR